MHNCRHALSSISYTNQNACIHTVQGSTARQVLLTCGCIKGEIAHTHLAICNSSACETTERPREERYFTTEP